ncbi:MAG: hypothetical protein ACKOW5_12935 [Actinomycetales bacterium]
MTEHQSAHMSSHRPIVTTVVAAFLVGLATGFVIKLVLPRQPRQASTD